MILELLDEKLPGAIADRHDFRGDHTIVVMKERFLEVVDAIHAQGFQFLVDVTAVDWLERDPRFEVVYHWLNLTNQERLRLKVQINDGVSLPSLVSRFKTADWYEREVFDMFGVRFDDHPDLQRLLTWTDFPGHALRKDFPLDGGDPFCMADSTAPYTR
jgi:NADH-quinone oxidoreductase subunit C